MHHFPNVFATLPLLPLLELSLLADAQAEEEKNDKSDLRNLNIVYFHFFPRVTALPVSSESAVCPSASQPLSALNAVLASHSSDAIYRKVKITEESPAKVVCNYVSGFFSSALIKGETEPIICHSHIISEIRLP